MSSVVSHDSLARQIDELLPQTQCTKCGYAGCMPYANAIASGDADINRCPPGGQAGISRLAELLQRPGGALDPACGTERDLTVAVIDESLCIGCTLCIAACPVDAIVGAAKRMHTVIASVCTGCDLCLPPCPTDCIVMVPVEPAQRWTTADAERARVRYVERQRRLATANMRLQDHLERKEPADGVESAERQRRTAVVQAAIERARARRQPRIAR